MTRVRCRPERASEDQSGYVPAPYFFGGAAGGRMLEPPRGGFARALALMGSRG